MKYGFVMSAKMSAKTSAKMSANLRSRSVILSAHALIYEHLSCALAQTK